MPRIKLDAEQEAAVERMVNEPTRAALNASQYGTGKTVVTVEVAARLGGSIQLIIAPLGTKYSWKGTILSQYPESEVRFINSSKSGKLALADLVSGVAGWYIIGREYFATKSVREQILPKSHLIDFAAYDECQKWSNYKSQGWRNVMKKFKPKYKMALSATPAGNKFSGLYTITHWLWPKYEGHDSFWTFVGEHCEVEQDFFSGTVITGEKAPAGHYVNNLPCYIQLEKDFGEPIEVQYEIDLSPAERRIYDAFEKTMIVWLKENPLVAKFPITKRIRLRQMTLGMVTVDENENVYFDKDMVSSKYNTLKEILGDHNEPALILTDSAKYANVVAWQLIRDGYKALPWTGEVPEKERHAVKDAFVNGDIDYIVATIPSIGEGIDGLQHRARLMIWLSRSDNNMLNQQAFRRLYRRGQNKQVVSIDIVARDTYDSGVLSTLIQTQLKINASLKKEG